MILRCDIAERLRPALITSQYLGLPAQQQQGRAILFFYPRLSSGCLWRLLLMLAGGAVRCGSFSSLDIEEACHVGCIKTSIALRGPFGDDEHGGQHLKDLRDSPMLKSAGVLLVEMDWGGS